MPKKQYLGFYIFGCVLYPMQNKNNLIKHKRLDKSYPVWYQASTFVYGLWMNNNFHSRFIIMNQGFKAL